MKLLDFLRLGRPKEPPSASTAKQRLQVLIAHEGRTGGPDFLPLLQKELIEVIRKYVEVDQSKVKIELERSNDVSVLEVNIELPPGVRGRVAV
ncbi:MAG TPA: cell division topological specificity factor MinE [Geminicoccaceae bacterium]|nr:cell division topological specificity factor MinE [Geminicoccaceae bacterium]